MKTTISWRIAAAVSVAAAVLASPAATRAQADREDLVNRGIDQYLDFQPDSAIAYLIAAVDPDLAAPNPLCLLLGGGDAFPLVGVRSLASPASHDIVSLYHDPFDGGPGIWKAVIEPREALFKGISADALSSHKYDLIRKQLVKEVEIVPGFLDEPAGDRLVCF